MSLASMHVARCWVVLLCNKVACVLAAAILLYAELAFKLFYFCLICRPELEIYHETLRKEIPFS